MSSPPVVATEVTRPGKRERTSGATAPTAVASSPPAIAPGVSCTSRFTQMRASFGRAVRRHGRHHATALGDEVRAGALAHDGDGALRRHEDRAGCAGRHGRSGPTPPWAGLPRHARRRPRRASAGSCRRRAAGPSAPAARRPARRRARRACAPRRPRSRGRPATARAPRRACRRRAGASGRWGRAGRDRGVHPGLAAGTGRRRSPRAHGGATRDRLVPRWPRDRVRRGSGHPFTARAAAITVRAGAARGRRGRPPRARARPRTPRGRAAAPRPSGRGSRPWSRRPRSR